MIKKAVVETGKTPSILSGKPSNIIENEEAISSEEILKDTALVKKAMEKLVKEDI